MLHWVLLSYWFWRLCLFLCVVCIYHVIQAIRCWILFLWISRTAYDVTLVDDSWPKDAFDVVSGNASQSWERLDAWVPSLSSWLSLLQSLVLFSFFPSNLSTYRKTFWLAVEVFYLTLLNWRAKWKECSMVHQLWSLSVYLQNLLYRLIIYTNIPYFFWSEKQSYCPKIKEKILCSNHMIV